MLQVGRVDLPKEVLWMRLALDRAVLLQVKAGDLVPIAGGKMAKVTKHHVLQARATTLLRHPTPTVITAASGAPARRLGKGGVVMAQAVLLLLETAHSLCSSM